MYPTGKYDKIVKGVEKKKDINEFHRCLNHRNKGDLRRTASKLNLKLTGGLNPCMQCAHAKIKRKKIRKDFMENHELPRERIAIDCTVCKISSIGDSKIMNLKYDYGSRKLWC